VAGPAADTYNWDANTGRLTSRTVAGKSETFTWDPMGRLGTVAGPDGMDTFTYGADGERVMRTTPLGRTIYVAGHEVSANLNGSNVRATRSYRFGGELIATRSPSGLDYIISDQQGSVEATYASGGSLETSRAYSPYGKRRSGGEFDTDQGWLGEIEDDHSALSYMNARYYDPNIGTFISPDPVVDTAHPKSLNAYAYALNNPITYSDPTGLCVAIDGLCPQRWKDPYAIAIASTHAGTTQSAAMAHVRPKNYHYNPSNPQPGPDPVALALAEMYLANPDPAFWHAVAAAGGGAAFIGAAKSIAVGNLMNINPDPGFWNAIAASGGGAAFIAGVRRMMARRSAIGRYELDAAEVKHRETSQITSDEWSGGYGSPQSGGAGAGAAGAGGIWGLLSRIAPDNFVIRDLKPGLHFSNHQFRIEYGWKGPGPNDRGYHVNDPMQPGEHPGVAKGLLDAAGIRAVTSLVNPVILIPFPAEPFEDFVDSLDSSCHQISEDEWSATCPA
jgi:RHS repeat-associated protein